MKGGHNNEHHNHNDVGSYIVVVAGRMPLADPGAEVYTARTFSSRRYDSSVISSFGHPVPRVAGQLQRAGGDARARVLETRFADGEDVLRLDLRAAYAVPELRSLERTFAYDRSGAASLRVRDAFAFDGPRGFETAVVTFGTWSRDGQDRIVIRDGPASVSIAIAASAAFDIREDAIREDMAGDVPPPTRLAIALKEPAAEGHIELRIAAAP
jgi:hypothetical protein